MFTCLPQLGTYVILKYETGSSLAVGPNGRDNTKQVPLCHLISIFFQNNMTILWHINIVLYFL